ncbi:hypothetical protein H0H87_007605, partial [Tephrocybe sp. NHM501043]
MLKKASTQISEPSSLPTGYEEDSGQVENEVDQGEPIQEDPTPNHLPSPELEGHSEPVHAPNSRTIESTIDITPPNEGLSSAQDIKLPPTVVIEEVEEALQLENSRINDPVDVLKPAMDTIKSTTINTAFRETPGMTRTEKLEVMEAILSAPELDPNEPTHSVLSLQRKPTKKRVSWIADEDSIARRRGRRSAALSKGYTNTT